MKLLLWISVSNENKSNTNKMIRTQTFVSNLKISSYMLKLGQPVVCLFFFQNNCILQERCRLRRPLLALEQAARQCRYIHSEDDCCCPSTAVDRLCPSVSHGSLLQGSPSTWRWRSRSRMRKSCGLSRNREVR